MGGKKKLRQYCWLHCMTLNKKNIYSAILQFLYAPTVKEMILQIFILNAVADACLLRFLDVVLEQSQKRQAGVMQFLEWWDLYSEKISVIVPEAENAIRIMTIHKSKGLQFPAVIVPYAHWSTASKP